MQTQPMEDIDAVLGRFQAWAGARNAVETKPGVRELTYEEALQSSRYRWRGASAQPQKSSTETVAGSNAVPDTASEQETTRAETAPVKGRNTKSKASEKKRYKKRTTKASKRASKLSVAKEAPAASPEFREALAEAVRPVEVVVAAQPAETVRHTAISIRLAPAERALIKTRADESGISASAYMRQCALEVEQLRAQVRDAIATMEHGVAAPVKGSIPAHGFFARIARRFFSGSGAALVLWP